MALLAPVILQIRVKPRSKCSSLEQLTDGTWTAAVRASPVDGKANDELVRLIARHFLCPKSAVRITAGAAARVKLVRVERP